jgi:translocation and assembly module TamB
VSGKVQLAGTPSAPQFEGAIEWKNGRIAFPAPWQPVEDIEARLGFHADEAAFEETRGRMGEGTFGLAGKIGLANLRELPWEFQLRGANLDFFADENLQLRGTPDFAARGSRQSGAIQGILGLDGSAVLRGLTITPQLSAAAPVSAPPASSPAATSLAAWTVDLKMSSATPISVGREDEGGTLTPDLYLQGTVGEPLLLGTIGAEKLSVRWPSEAKLTAAGRVHFTREKPWMPVLDLTGVGQAGPYDIRAGVFGPVDERRLLVSSSPPLTTEQIVLLLTTGVSPVPLPPSAPATPEDKLTAEPSWLELDSIRGLLGWNTGEGAAGGEGEAISLGGGTVGYEWNWR